MRNGFVVTFSSHDRDRQLRWEKQVKSNQTPPPSESSEGVCCLQDLDSITDLLPLGTVDYGGIFGNPAAVGGGIAAATAAAAVTPDRSTAS